MRRPPSSAGFTIIEVMLAVAILVTLTSLMWVSISSMFTSRDAIEQRSARFQQVRVTMNRMAEELAAGYMGGPEFGAEELPGEESFGAPPEEGDEEEAAMLAASSQEEIQLGFIGRDDELSFTTFAHVRTDPRQRASDHAEIGYFIRSERDEEGRTVRKLMRREDVSTDDDITRGGVVYTMVPEVESILFEYWDAGQVEIGTFEEIAQGRWVKEWNTTRREYAGRLPTRVRITLTLPPQGNNEEPETFVTQTEIHVTEVLEF